MKIYYFKNYESTYFFVKKPDCRPLARRDLTFIAICDNTFKLVCLYIIYTSHQNICYPSVIYRYIQCSYLYLLLLLLNIGRDRNQSAVFILPSPPLPLNPRGSLNVSILYMLNGSPSLSV